MDHRLLLVLVRFNNYTLAFTINNPVKFTVWTTLLFLTLLTQSVSLLSIGAILIVKSHSKFLYNQVNQIKTK